MISHNHHQPNPRQTLTRQTMPRQHRSGRSREAHSVETLVSTYIGAMEGDDTEANTLVDQSWRPVASRSLWSTRACECRVGRVTPPTT